MQDSSDRFQRQRISNLHPPMKKLGSYLVDAGLLTTDQIQVILIDQQSTGMRFGEIAVARGWMKEQTIEWIVAKVVEPERQALEQQESGARWNNGQSQSAATSGATLLQKMPLRAAAQATSAASRAAGQATTPSASRAADQTTAPPTNPSTTPSKPYMRREVPISKPLPSVGPSDEDVNWVG